MSSFLKMNNFFLNNKKISVIPSMKFENDRIYAYLICILKKVERLFPGSNFFHTQKRKMENSSSRMVEVLKKIIPTFLG